MAETKVRKIADNKWELTVELDGDEGKETFVVYSKEEADRLAKAYLENRAGNKTVQKQIARTAQNKPKTTLLS